MAIKSIQSLLLRIGSSLLLLAICTETTFAETKQAEPGLPLVSSYDFADCAQELRPWRGGCALLLDRTAVQTLSLAPQPDQNSPTGIALPEHVLKQPPNAVGSTNGKRPISYMTAAAGAVEPSGSDAGKPANAGTPQPHWSRLPIWGAEAEARGYRVPLPFGVGVTYYDARQPVDVSDLKLSAGGSPPESSKFVKVGRPITSWQQNVSSRFDVWLFPFFNIYGVAGYTRGNTRGVVTITSPVFGLLNQDLPLLAEFHGPTMGGGATLAAGLRVTDWRDLHAFMVGDVNHTVTFLKFKNESLIAETKPRATVASTRVGVRGAVTESIHASLWAGAMYQLIQEEVAGSVAGRTIEFVINQSAASPWNMLIGGQIELGRDFNLLVEGGVGPRSSILTGAVFRF